MLGNVYDDWWCVVVQTAPSSRTRDSNVRGAPSTIIVAVIHCHVDHSNAFALRQNSRGS